MARAASSPAPFKLLQLHSLNGKFFARLAKPPAQDAYFSTFQKPTFYSVSPSGDSQEYLFTYSLGLALGSFCRSLYIK